MFTALYVWSMTADVKMRENSLHLMVKNMLNAIYLVVVDSKEMIQSLCSCRATCNTHKAMLIVWYRFSVQFLIMNLDALKSSGNASFWLTMPILFPNC